MAETLCYGFLFRISGIALSHAALIDKTGHASSSDVLLCMSTLDWWSGIFTLLLGTISGSKRIITKQRFSPEVQLRLIEQYKATLMLNVTHQMIFMLRCEKIQNTDLKSIKVFIVGGTKVPNRAAIEFSKYLPNGQIRIGYGLSEVSGAISTKLLQSLQSGEDDSVGNLTYGVRAKIVDDNGNRCGIDIDGEICVKFNYEFLGYYGNQAATDEIIDSEGFLKTGDIGHFDNTGSLHFVDRKKELLKYCDEHILPSEIEIFLMDLSSIRSACVVGIPDANVGDLVAALVVRKEGSRITEQGIHDAVLSKTFYFLSMCLFFFYILSL